VDRGLRSCVGSYAGEIMISPNPIAQYYAGGGVASTSNPHNAGGVPSTSNPHNAGGADVVLAPAGPRKVSDVRIEELENLVKVLTFDLKNLRSEQAETKAEVDNLKQVLQQAVDRQQGKVGYWQER
jgi:hypothetical protein